jgi:hypothetical protein
MNPTAAQIHFRSTWRRVLGALGIGALLPGALLLLLLLTVDARPAFAQATPPGDLRAAALAGLNLSLRVDSPTSSDFVTDTVVVNSQIVTYEASIVNNSASTLSNVRIETVLPVNNMSEVFCPSCTDRRVTVIQRVDEVGELDTVTVTRELIWSLSGTIPPGGGSSVRFMARIIGQAAGAPVENTALVFYTANGLADGSVSNKARVVIVPDVPQAAVTQETTVSATPNWFSSDQGGTMDMDWADVDGDGDLDLALASTLGVNVYANDKGQMKLLWTDPKRQVSYGVRWVDVNSNSSPELVSVGGAANDKGLFENSVYLFNPGTTQSPTRFSLMENGVFTSTDQIIRIEPADFNADGRTDLLLSVNALVSDCPLYIAHNRQNTLYSGQKTCVSGAATAAISPADFDRDGDMDVAAGIFPNEIWLFINNASVITSTRLPTTAIFIDSPGYFLPYDFAWGDVDNDGDLDLAAAFPLQREVHIYRNQGGNQFSPISPVLRTSVFLTPYALDFGDIDRDGWLDLLVADVQPTIFWNRRDPQTPYSRSAADQTQLQVSEVSGERAQVWSIRAVDQDKNGSLEVAVANRAGPSLLLANYAPMLSGQLTANFEAGAASSVAWGDVDANGFDDLLFGSPANRNTSRLFFNDSGQFSFANSQNYDVLNSIGAHDARLGDVDGGGIIDVALAVPGGMQLAINGGDVQDLLLPMLPSTIDRTAAWGDIDGDGDLDMAIAGQPGPLVVVRNEPTGNFASLNTVIVRSNAITTTAIAWGDLNGDHYLDMAVANQTGGVTVYVNNSDNTFTPLSLASTPASNAVTACGAADARSVAWGDLDGDDDLDLAVGNANAPNCLYFNQNGAFVTAVQFGGDETTVTLNWGDWDNDGDLDLAVGNDSAPAQVYSNIGNRLVLIWQSEQSYSTSEVAWGDVDRDGDLDLALAQTNSNAQSGYFENSFATPYHLTGAGTPGQLSNQSAYAYVRRPGVTDSAYLYSSSELVGLSSATVPVRFRLYDPQGDDKPARPLNLLFEYSLNGGGQWKSATPSQSTDFSGTMTRDGTDYQFIWNARADGAIGENAHFRVSVINDSQDGQVQQASGVGISPPFQVRGTSCIWPARPSILINDGPVSANSTFPIGDGQSTTSLDFSGILPVGSGLMQFVWDFGNGVTTTGQKISQSFTNGAYTVKLTVLGEACPQRRFVTTSAKINVGTGVSDIYLPIILRTETAASSAVATAASTQFTQTAIPAQPASLSPPQGLMGEIIDDEVHLQWQPVASVADQLHVLRAARNDQTNAQRIATLPPNATSYQATALCDTVYSVSAATVDGAELISDSSFFTLPCAEGGQNE